MFVWEAILVQSIQLRPHLYTLPSSKREEHVSQDMIGNATVGAQYTLLSHICRRNRLCLAWLVDGTEHRSGSWVSRSCGVV